MLPICLNKRELRRNNMKLNKGEIATLDNDKEYICVATLTDNGKDYVFLMSNFKPLEIRFAIQTLNANNELELEIVNDESEKRHILELLQKN